MSRAIVKHANWWVVLLLLVLLRALIPVGFMPMLGADFSLKLVVCDGDGPLAIAPSISMPMSMDMPPGMVMDGSGLSTGSSDPHPGHGSHGTCPYGSAPALGALPSLAMQTPLLIRRALEAALATAQVASVEVSRRAHSPRGPPV